MSSLVTESDTRRATRSFPAFGVPSGTVLSTREEIEQLVERAEQEKLAREQAIRAEVRSRRAWGYIFWGLMGVFIFVPEILAVTKKEWVPWPTISGTIGQLEYWHPWVSLIVVGVIAWWALHVVEFGPEKTLVLGVDVQRNPKNQYLNTPGGWSTRASELRPVSGTVGVIYIALATIAVIAPSLYVAKVVRPADEHVTGWVLYGLIFIFWILIPLALAYPGKEVPWPTLFETFRDFSTLRFDRFKIVATLIGGGIVVLLIHLVLYPWPVIIPDLKDLHEQNKQQRQEEKERNEPSPEAP